MNIGFILHSKLVHEETRNKICHTAYFELERVSSVRRFLTEDVAQTLVTSRVLSRIDYCNCLLLYWCTQFYYNYNLPRKFRTLPQDSFS